MLVKFENVGRAQATWDEEMRVLTPGAVLSVLRKRKVLASRLIDLDFDASTGEGVIYAGDRAVGMFRIAERQS